MKPQVAQTLEAELAARGLRIDKTGDAYGSTYTLKADNGTVYGNVTTSSNLSDMSTACAKAYWQLATDGDLADLVRVTGSIVHNQDQRGRGLGTLLYRYVVEDIARDHKALAPDNCGNWGSTSEDALRVWDRLSTEYSSAPYTYTQSYGGKKKRVRGRVVGKFRT